MTIENNEYLEQLDGKSCKVSNKGTLSLIRFIGQKSEVKA